MERREFFRSLVAGGATVKTRPERRNQRAHHQGERIYHGPMAIPERVAKAVAEHPALAKTTHRHLISRYADGFGWVWRFRCQIPESRLMVGEIVRTPEGGMRVHCWSAADPERYTRGDEPAAIVGAKASRSIADVLPPPPIRPDKLPLPILPPSMDYGFVSPADAERLMREALEL